MTATHHTPRPRRSRGKEPVGLLGVVLGVVAAVALPAAIAQVWWRSEHMCAEGIGCDRAAVYIVLPALLLGLVFLVGPMLMRRPGAINDVRTTRAILLALAVAQLSFAAPVSATWTDGCHRIDGRTIRAITIDRGPFSYADVPAMGIAVVPLGPRICSQEIDLESPAPIWRPEVDE